MSSSPGTPVGGTVRTLAVLEFIASSARPVSATEIARATDLNPSTAFNITRTLAAAGYVQTTPGGRLYMIGSALQALARTVSRQEQPRELARLPMQAVANQFEVTVSLWRRTSRYTMTMLAAAENQAATQILVRVGARVPLMHGSMGRLLARRADLSDEERREVFNVVNAERPLSYRTFMRQAAEAAQRGWSIDDGHIRTAVTSVSVPVETGSSELEYVCTATMFHGQYKGDALERFVEEFKRLALKLSSVYTVL